MSPEKELELGKTKDRFPWEKLPYELRELIFKDVRRTYTSSMDARYYSVITKPYFTWRGPGLRGIPPLVIALRTLPVSHAHVVEVFNRSAHMLNDDLTGFQFTDMNEVELAGVRSLQIDITSAMFNDWKTQDAPAARPRLRFKKSKQFTDYFLKLANVHIVSISIRDCDRYLCTCNYCEFNLSFISEFPFWLKGFKNLQQLEVEIPLKHILIGAKRRSRMIKGLNKKILKDTGVQGVVKKKDVGRNCEVWVWKAAAGQRMNWSQDFGWTWNLPHRPRRNKKRFSEACYELGMRDGQFILERYDCDNHQHSECPFPYRE